MLDAQLQDLLLGIPNLPADDGPDGASEDDAELIRTWGDPPAFDFTARDHVDLGETLGILDFARATKLAGPAVRGAARARAPSSSGRWPATSSTSPRRTATPSSRCPRWSTARR